MRLLSKFALPLLLVASSSFAEDVPLDLIKGTFHASGTYKSKTRSDVWSGTVVFTETVARGYNVLKGTWTITAGSGSSETSDNKTLYFLPKGNGTSDVYNEDAKLIGYSSCDGNECEYVLNDSSLANETYVFSEDGFTVKGSKMYGSERIFWKGSAEKQCCCCRD